MLPNFRKGTGTPTGNLLEVTAAARVWGDRGGILIRAVKPNVGHSGGAAGLTRVIKSALVLENKVIPPNIHCGTLNPKNYPREVDVETWYRRAQALGIEWKTAFQGLDIITAWTVASEELPLRLAVHQEQDMHMRINGSVVIVENEDAATVKRGRRVPARAAMFRDDGVPIADMDGLDFVDLPVASKRDTDVKLKDSSLLLGSRFT
ncbi:hypothetical protein MCOR25_010723 [Pyricularia grisea]|nr:hypothetical protein MCOR25_010723 [Pyricularia grisea]